jgi:hypothetical protein
MSIRRSVLKRDSRSLDERAASITSSQVCDDVECIQFLHTITLKRNAEEHLLESLNRPRTAALLRAVARALSHCLENVSTHDLQTEPKRLNRHFTLKLNEDLDSTDEDEDEGAPRPFKLVMQTAGEMILGRFYFLPQFDSIMRTPIAEYSRGEARHLTEISHRLLFSEEPRLYAGTMLGLCILVLHWIQQSRPIFKEGPAADCFARLLRRVREATDEYCTVSDGHTMNAELFGLGFSCAADCGVVFKHLRTFYENYLAAQDDPFKAELRRLVHSLNHFLVLCGEPVILTASLTLLVEKEAAARKGLWTLERDSFMCIAYLVTTQLPQHGTRTVRDTTALALLLQDEAFQRSLVSRTEESKFQFVKRAFESAKISAEKDVRAVALVQPLACRPPSASSSQSSQKRSYAADPDLAKQRFFLSGRNVVKDPTGQLMREELGQRSGLERAEKDVRMLVMLQERRIREGWVREVAAEKIEELEIALNQVMDPPPPGLLEELGRLRTKESMRRTEIHRLAFFELDLIFRRWFADGAAFTRRLAMKTEFGVRELELAEEESRQRLHFVSEETLALAYFLHAFTVHPKRQAVDCGCCPAEESIERQAVEAHEQRGRRAVYSLATIDRRASLAPLLAASKGIADAYVLQAAQQLLEHTHALERMALEGWHANSREALALQRDFELLALQQHAQTSQREVSCRDEITDEEATVFDCCIAKVFEVEARCVQAEQDMWRQCEETGDRSTSATVASQHAALVLRLQESVASLVPSRPGTGTAKRPASSAARGGGPAAPAVPAPLPTRYTRPFSSKWRQGLLQI